MEAREEEEEEEAAPLTRQCVAVCHSQTPTSSR